MTGDKMKVRTPTHQEGTLSTRRHYERWPFPGVNFMSRESLLLLRCLQQWLDRKKPDGMRPPARVVDVGCGTGETVIGLARHFPDVEFWGVDIARQSLSEARRTARRFGVKNVTFREADILKDDLSGLGTFRALLCLGVLHHTPDITEGLKKTVVLANKGALVLLWLYGRFGRFPHQANQQFLRALAKGASPRDSFSLAEEFLQSLGDRFVRRTGFYTPKGDGDEGLQWLLDHPRWLADQMIPAQEHSVTMETILDLFEETGLRFAKWLGGPSHLHAFTSSERLLTRFGSLSPREQLIALDCLVKPSYYFVAGERER